MKSFLSWYNGCWTTGVEELAVIKKRPEFQEMLPQDQPTEAAVQTRTFVLELNTVISKTFSGGTGFEGMKQSQGAAKTWSHERPIKATGEGGDSVAGKSPKLNGLWRETKTSTN